MDQWMEIHQEVNRIIGRFNPVVKISESGNPLRAYLQLLNLTYLAPDALSQMEGIAREESDLQDAIVLFLAHFDWRTHLLGGIYILFTGLTDQTREALWDAISRGSWVGPQLAVIAYLVDADFVPRAHDQVLACLGADSDDSSTMPKTVTALLELCRRIDAAAPWLESVLADERLPALVDADPDRGDQIASAWLDRIQEIFPGGLVEPGEPGHQAA